MRILLIILMLTTAAGCKEKYDLPHAGPSRGYLVVDGTINSGQGPTTIRLSRTLALVDSVPFRNETDASVWVEGENNTQQLLQETTGGVYTHPQLNIAGNVKYRLLINTKDGKIYSSPFTAAKKTPPIDAIGWERSDDGVQFFVNTHDPQNATRYYRWECDETWEFRSTYMSLLQYKYNSSGLVVDVEPRPYAETLKMYTCWAEERTKNILIGSSVKLSRDTIHLPLHFIPKDSWKISVLYSVNIKQHALSAEGYEFLQRMKKNTEQVGSLFDAQPSELRGNIESADDPSEIVVGYVEISDLQQKRIFIDRSEVLPWLHGMPSCFEESIVNIPDSVMINLTPTTTDKMSPSGRIERYFAAPHICVDCTLRGVNMKPSFWP